MSTGFEINVPQKRPRTRLQGLMSEQVVTVEKPISSELAESTERNRSEQIKTIKQKLLQDHTLENPLESPQIVETHVLKLRKKLEENIETQSRLKNTIQIQAQEIIDLKRTLERKNLQLENEKNLKTEYKSELESIVKEFEILEEERSEALRTADDLARKERHQSLLLEDARQSLRQKQDAYNLLSKELHITIEKHEKDSDELFTLRGKLREVELELERLQHRLETQQTELDQNKEIGAAWNKIQNTLRTL